MDVAARHRSWFRAASNGRRRDRDASAACFAPDFATVDHRTLGFGTANRAEFLERRRAMAEVIPDSSQIFTKQYSQGHAGIVVVHLTGTTAEGNEYDWHYVSVVVANERDLISRMEYFPDDQWPEALARFDELAAEDDAATPPMENTAVRTWAGIIDARATGDAARAVELVAPDVVGIDRRAGVSVPDLVGREALATNAAAIEEVFGVASRSFDVVAVRGDRLALLRARVTNTEGFGIEGLLVVEVSENGQLTRSVYFDETDLLAARSELDARHRAIDRFPALENRATAAGQGARDAALRGDRDATLDAFAPDFTRIEHRAVAMSLEGTMGREIYVDGMLAGPDAGLTRFDATTVEIVGDDHALTHIVWHNEEGFGQEWLVVSEVDGAGRLRRVANFDPDDRAAASALLHLWAVERGESL